MNAELLRGWLGLTEATWPPEPHALLGVTPGENDLARIEHQTHERLAKLRCYQISHPEEATEGMNRLAQAFVQLMDCCPKNPAAEPVAPPSDSETVIERKTRLDWQAAPPPVRRSGPTPALGVNGSKKPIPKAQPAPHVHDTQKMIRDLARHSPAARAGLGTLDAVVRRSRDTRRLLIAWTKVGKWLREPKRKLAKPADDLDLTRRLSAVNDALRSFPAIIAQPGTPGYRVAATARLELGSLLVRGMDPAHREILATDWANGRNVLLAYRRYLHEQFKAMRESDPTVLLMRAIRFFVNDHPYIIVGLVGAAAVAVAFWIWR